MCEIGLNSDHEEGEIKVKEYKRRKMREKDSLDKEVACKKENGMMNKIIPHSEIASNAKKGIIKTISMDEKQLSAGELSNRHKRKNQFELFNTVQKEETVEIQKEDIKSDIVDKVCLECGVTIKLSNNGNRQQTRNGVTSFQRHLMLHKVDNFTCSCTIKEKIHKFNNMTPYLAKERHMKIVHMEWYGCSKCRWSFETLDELTHHTKKHDKNDLGLIKKKIKKRDYSALRKHPKNLLCTYCGEDISNNQKEYRNAIIDLHLLKHQVENFQCDCPHISRLIKNPFNERRNKDYKLIEKHMKTVHQGWFGCKECTKSFETLDGLHIHIEKHKELFICSVCGHQAKQRTLLTQHTLDKHEAISVLCPDCGKELKSNIALSYHKRKVHVNAPCKICGLVRVKMKQHMEEAHIKASEKKFQCQNCNKGFMSKQKFDGHMMNVHIKSHPFRCRYGCSNSYNDRSNMAAHERRRHGRVYTNTLNVAK